MQKVKLKNGLTIIYDKQPTRSVSIQVNVKVGSNYEDKKNNGISHFIEHMLFEGTNKRTNQQIANEIERLGGEINAATSTERTYYYIKILNKYFDNALEILSDIIQNPRFDKESIEKEKKVILNEINLINDEPRFYQWILLQKTLFDSTAKLPTYGDKKVIKNLTRKNILDYYNKYYCSNNIVISVVGNIKNPISKIKKKKFDKLEYNKLKKLILKESKNKSKKITEKRKINQTYMLLGYKIPNRDSKESYVFDVLHAILGRGQSGRLFDEIRQKRGLAYEVGVQHESGIDVSLFAVYVNTHKKNINEIIKIILGEFNKLKKIDKKSLNEAKTHLEGSFALEAEDTREMSNLIGFWELVNKAENVKDYIKNIKKVTINDVKKVVSKYLNKKHTLAVLSN